MQRDPSDREDLRKVEECLAGDRTAFEFLFEKYRERVYAVAFRLLRNKEDALETVQEVFLRVHQGLRGFKSDARFFTWLYRITINRAIDFARSRRSRRAVELSAGDEEGQGLAETVAHPASPDPQVLLLKKEAAERLLKAVEELSPKHRAVFVLHAMENLSYKEIAEVVGCTIGTVMSRLFYARRKLRLLLAEYQERTP